MDAKNNFREGHIILQRPFDFYELEYGIPKMTILYAYIERPLFDDELTPEGRERLDRVKHAGSFYAHPSLKKGIFETQKAFEERISKEFDRIASDASNYKKKHVGNMVQSSIGEVQVSFWPDEYKVLDPDILQEVLYDDSYHMITSNENVFNLPEMEKKIFYLQSRGISKKKAQRLCSFGLKDLVAYFPHPELQKMFCRDHEVVYMPEFEEYYNSVYGSFAEYKETC